MRKMLLIIAALAVGLVLAGVAYGATGYGQVVYNGGGPCVGCNVRIHNGQTGAYGSTLTNGSGVYVVNMNNADRYEFSVDTCKVHSYYSSAWLSAWGNSSFLPTLTASPLGGC